MWICWGLNKYLWIIYNIYMEIYMDNIYMEISFNNLIFVKLVGFDIQTFYYLFIRIIYT